MPLDTVFTRTRSGALAAIGRGTPLSGGFRQLLNLIDGKKVGREVLAGMPQLDEEDFDLWTSELLHQGLIAAADAVPVDELAFSMTTEMSASALAAVQANADALIEDIMADVSKSLDPALRAETESRLRTTGRMAAIESVSSRDALGRAGFFVYPDAAAGMPAAPRVCVAGHQASQNRVLELLLTRAGIKPVVATTRDALRELLKGRAKPDLLLVDTEMPMLDAYRTLDAMRVDSTLKGVRVVLISERGARSDLARAMMLGATAYIVKPLRKDILDAALPQILGRPTS
jgi:PleD family two-component response regulator